MNARRANLILVYNGANISADIAPFFLEFSYTDNVPGKADDLQLTLEDRKGLWQGPWFPQVGDSISASIIVESSDVTESSLFPCGDFEIDSFGAKGPPGTVEIKGVSVAVSSRAKKEQRTKAWQNVTLQTIAGDIAKRAKLKLMWAADHNPKFARMDQVKEADLAFLNRLANSAGLAVKVSGGKLVVFDEEKFDAKSSVLQLVKGESNILQWSFDTGSFDTYSEAEVSYYDPELGQNVTASFKPAAGPKNGQKLVLNTRVDAGVKYATKEAKTAAAKQIGKKALRAKNKLETVVRMTVVGDTRLAASNTVDVSGWGVFDGKYYIESAVHTVGSSGYTVALNMRRALEGY